MPSGIRVVSVVDAIADNLRDAILGGELLPGTALTETDVATRFDVARPTAKAAIEKLVGDMLLERPNHKTARVRRLGPEDVRDIYRTRATIESEVLRQLAIKRLVPAGTREANTEIKAAPDSSAFSVVKPDMAFHTALIDGIGSVRTSRLYRSLASEVTLCMAQVQGRHLLDTKMITAEHDGLLDLVGAGDGAGAAALLDIHLSRARERLVGALGGTPGPEADLELTVPLAH
ncbi:GntR family transcriptional regulator [Mycolicibacterium sp. CR10]|uniref:GntR family transcriptional regulator n=1 Tax=Mycolicibacterium sp. CR10 TaxID=2562314 RepID=UPI0010C0D398|nr:GntR family transcriptional regulator [Mycolicibacterium sp. CR10]